MYSIYLVLVQDFIENACSKACLPTLKCHFLVLLFEIFLQKLKITKIS